MWCAAPRLALPTLLLTTLLATGVWGECRLDECTNAYLAGQESGIKEGPTPAFCSLAQRHASCTAPLERSCRGEIGYHTTVQWLSNLLERYNCTKILEQFPQALPENPRPASPTRNTCVYDGSSKPAHCGLFGDPHLKTFTGEYMTCGVGGAWPLLNTPHLAIQVTNKKVSEATDATATTKVTVIVKGHDVCGPERTYEASTEALPRAFVDGTTWAGGTALQPHTQVREEKPGEHILITVSHVNATIAVRKIGRYLTVLVRVPESVLGAEGDQGEMQLCVQGCPVNERLNSITSHQMTKHDAVKYCKEYNVTDYYLDSCIFDLITTGDKSFRVAALAAQKDLWEHDPAGAQKLLQNCSEPPCLWDVTSAATTTCSSVAVLFVLGVALFEFRRQTSR